MFYGDLVIAALLKEIGDKDIDYMETILCYTLEKGESKQQKEEVFSLFKKVIPESKKGLIMTIEDQIRQEGEEVGIQFGMEKGIEKGIEKGKTERDTEIAKAMLLEGIAIDLVMKTTSLSKEELLKLKDTTKH